MVAFLLCAFGLDWYVGRTLVGGIPTPRSRRGGVNFHATLFVNAVNAPLQELSRGLESDFFFYCFGQLSQDGFG